MYQVHAVLLILIFDQQHSVGNAPPRRLHGLRIAVVSIWVMGLTAGLPPLIPTNYHVRHPLSDWYQSTAISMCLIEVYNFTSQRQWSPYTRSCHTKVQTTGAVMYGRGGWVIIFSYNGTLCPWRFLDACQRACMQQFHYIPRHISAASLLVLCIAGSTGAALLPLLWTLRIG